MAYSIPNLNLVMCWWPPATPPITGPCTETVAAQLYYHSRTDATLDPGQTFDFTPSVFIRIKTGDIYTLGLPLVGSYFGVRDPTMTWWYWTVKHWEFTHLGFPNQYVSIQVEQCDAGGLTPDSHR